MALFKKNKKFFPALYYSLDKELERARKQKKNCFYYPLEDHEVSKAMAWGIRNRIGIEPDHITEGVIYYKFYGYLREEK